MEGRDLDAIVVELSGVADPAAVKQNWAQAVNVSTSVAHLCFFTTNVQNSSIIVAFYGE